MNLKQALKKKNKLVSLISNSLGKVLKYNTTESGTVKHYSSKESLDVLMVQLEELVQLKTSIHLANANVYSKIFKLSELKSLVKHIKQMECSEGNVYTYRSDTPRQMESEITIKDRDSLVEKLELEIEQIQDELDMYNVTTHI
jgi:hypothetical protein